MSNNIPQITDIATIRPMSERERWRYEFAKVALGNLHQWYDEQLFTKNQGVDVEQRIASRACWIADALLAKLEEKPPPAAK